MMEILEAISGAAYHIILIADAPKPLVDKNKNWNDLMTLACVSSSSLSMGRTCECSETQIQWLCHITWQLTVRKGGYLQGPIWITSLFIAEHFLYLVAEEEVRECRHLREIQKTKGIIYCWLWRWRGHMERDREQPLRPGRNPRLTAIKWARIAVLQPQGSEFFQQQEWALKQVLPRSLQMKT